MTSEPRDIKGPDPIKIEIVITKQMLDHMMKKDRIGFYKIQSATWPHVEIRLIYGIE